jgi:hypothetical protein
MRRIDWLNNEEPEEDDSLLSDVISGQLWKKYTSHTGKRGNETVFVVKGINKNSVSLKEILNLYGKGVNISIDDLRKDYILTNENQVKQMPRYINYVFN